MMSMSMFAQATLVKDIRHQGDAQEGYCTRLRFRRSLGNELPWTSSLVSQRQQEAQIQEALMQEALMP